MLPTAGRGRAMLPRLRLTTPQCNHREGCAEHKVPKVNGKDFKAQEHSQQLEADKLITKPKQLGNGNRDGFKPRGETSLQQGRLVYPHFL